jgi:hypothetical protein
MGRGVPALNGIFRRFLQYLYNEGTANAAQVYPDIRTQSLFELA